MGLAVRSSVFAAGVTKVTAPGGVKYEQGNPSDVWLVEADAPAQGGFAHVVGLAIVDAATGQVLATGVGAYNDQ